MWTKEFFELYEEYYFEFKEYTFSPFSLIALPKEMMKIRSFRAPFENHAIANADFDLGIERLGARDEKAYRRYLANYSETGDPHLTPDIIRIRRNLLEILRADEPESPPPAIQSRTDST